MDIVATDSHAEALSTLNTFAVDLTALALAGKLPTAYGRDREVDDVLRALASPGSLCPMLIGAPRGGKTALAHHVANRIARGECPDTLRDLRVFETAPTRLLSAFGPPAMLAARLGEYLPKLAGALDDFLLAYLEFESSRASGASEEWNVEEADKGEG